MNQPVIMQIILSCIAVLGIFKVARKVAARALGPVLACVWLLGTLFFLLFVWQPNLATRVSQYIGIGRGVDAALYLAVALLFYVVLKILIRLQLQEHLITKLVSELALLRADRRK